MIGQIVERQPLRLASDTKGPVQTCYLRNMMAHRSMAPVWDKSMHRQIDVQAFVVLKIHKTIVEIAWLPWN